ncbi:MAG: phosphate ABC transporter permease subunit PstC [Saprospiraceae bacterium]
MPVFNRQRRRILLNRLFEFLFKSAGYLCIVALSAIFVLLLYNSSAFFSEVWLFDFLTGLEWRPEEYVKDSRYGLLPLLASTLWVTICAMLIAGPLGVGVALYLSEYADKRVERILKPAIEILAAIPSVVVGFLGIVVLGPGLARLFGLSSGLNALNGAILLAIMALPTIITVAEDAIQAVSNSLKEASYGLGANKWQTLSRVVLPAAFPGVLAALMLGMGRAIGETMTVLMATGNAAAFPRGLFDAIRTITATIAIEMGEAPHQTTHYHGLFAIALALFLITMGVNALAERIANNFRRFQ